MGMSPPVFLRFNTSTRIPGQLKCSLNVIHPIRKKRTAIYRVSQVKYNFSVVCVLREGNRKAVSRVLKSQHIMMVGSRE
jgi:hypothetical protein